MNEMIPSLEIITTVACSVLIATTLVATLIHRAVKTGRTIAASGGVDALLLHHNAGFICMHICLLFVWLLFMRAAFDVVEHSDPLAPMIGFCAFLVGQAVMAASSEANAAKARGATRG
ncbi:hypothetical protein [Cupriavidus basilensis]|uniref:hypothetical protein n=1 Tax=Cupriavidus basilensis TaxID=68895 RepID=UPI0028449D13|nr:hypothetical protein [Cupriavidus basilensis]MDR3383933.1 hypothetical protein [Cupriavidus basilensis]